MTKADSDTPDIKALTLNIENELTKFALMDKNDCTKKAVKGCVYHVILKAIALTKDPQSDTGEIKRLFELAKDIIVSADLTGEDDLTSRLGDLINAIIDQSDISIQLRLYNSKNNEQIGQIFNYIQHNKELQSEDFKNIHENLTYVRRLLEKFTKSRSTLKVISIITAVVVFILFTIAATTGIMAVLVSSSSLGNNYDRSGFMHKPSVQYHYTGGSPYFEKDR